MKNLKIALFFALTASFLSACSESGYTPTPAMNAQTSPYYNGAQTGMQGGYNPYLQYQNGNYNNLNPQAQLQLQMQANTMYSCNYLQSPLHYYAQMMSNNCSVRRQPTYTPYSCACIQGPCNCAKVVAQVRSNCRYDTQVTTTRTTTTTTADCPNNTPVQNDGIDPKEQSILLTLHNADARALFERLARSPEEIKISRRENATSRTGTNYKCTKNGDKDNVGSEKTKDTYLCELDIIKSSGLVLQRHPIGKLAEALLASNTPYSGKNLSIDKSGEANIIMTGTSAEVLYKKLAGEAKADVINGAKVTAKTGKQVKCYTTTETSQPITECLIPIKADTGDAIELK